MMDLFKQIAQAIHNFCEAIAPIPPEGWEKQLDDALKCTDLEEAKKCLQFSRFPKWEQKEIYSTALWAFGWEFKDGHPLSDSLIEWMEELNPELGNYDKYIITDKHEK